MAPKTTPAKAGPKPKVQFMTKWHYDVLGEVKGIKAGILGLTKVLLADQDKRYESARNMLKKKVPGKEGGNRKSIIPKIPKASNVISDVGKFALTLGKIALAGTFIAGLLQETIGKWFDSLEFDSSSMGGLIGNALKDLLTKQPGEEDLFTRFKKAFKLGVKTSGYGAAAGFVAGGPVGMVAGAIIGLVGGILYSLLGSDRGDDAAALKKVLDKAAKDAVPWAIAGGIIGGLLLRTPQGIIAGAILGSAFGIIRSVMDPKILDNSKAETDRLIEAADGSEFMGGMKVAIGNFVDNFKKGVMNFALDTFQSVANLIYRKDPKRRAEMEALIDEARPKDISKADKEKADELNRELMDLKQAIKKFNFSAMKGEYDTDKPVLIDGEQVEYKEAIRRDLNSRKVALEIQLQAIEEGITVEEVLNPKVTKKKILNEKEREKEILDNYEKVKAKKRRIYSGLDKASDQVKEAAFEEFLNDLGGDKKEMYLHEDRRISTQKDTKLNALLKDILVEGSGGNKMFNALKKIENDKLSNEDKAINLVLQNSLDNSVVTAGESREQQGSGGYQHHEAFNGERSRDAGYGLYSWR